MDPRIGPQFLRAGLGFGGGCLPKDIRAFMARAGELGVDEALMFLRDIDDINIRRRQHTVDLALEALGGQAVGKRVGVWGAAFKPDSDDVRDSPALHVAAALRAAGATVTVHDPRAVDNARRLFSDLEYADTPAGAASGADVVLLLTEWRDYRDLDPALISDVVSARHIIDARNALDPVIWREAGWTYRALGRPIA
jgi:UDPglucose 6-dehydrogenase